MRLSLHVILSFCLYIVGFSQEVQSISYSNKKFEIVYQADVQYVNNPLWLKNIKDEWKATGVNLRIFRAQVEQEYGNLNWSKTIYNVDDAIRNIYDAGLDIYFRVNFTQLNNQLIKKYSDNDFHIRSNRKRFLNQYEISRPLLNITSQKSRNDLLGFLQNLLNHLNSFPKEIRDKIKLIVPTLSPDDETEFPFNTYDDSSKTIIQNVLTGFSNPEIFAFMNYLESKYGSINSLNESWGKGANFKGFDSSQIHIRNYDWDGIKSDDSKPGYYVYENGRKDFIDFRTSELKRFIDDCSEIVKKAGYNFGVQFGSIYDGLIEFRGFYDPTSLIENVDQFITGDILEYYPNFSFSADYSRSLCNYWSGVNKSTEMKAFCTETNWPGYVGHNSADIIKYWSLQIRTFYEKGASCLFVSHWGTVGSPEKSSEKVLAKSALTDYSAWQDTLSIYQNTPVRIVRNNIAYHLACEMILHSNHNSENNLLSFVHNQGFIIGNINNKNILEFPICRLAKANTNNEDIVYKEYGDFVTSYMLKNSPEYIFKNYKQIFKTGTSKFISKDIQFEF